MAAREREFQQLTDRLHGLCTALQTQQALASETIRQQEQACARSSPKKLKNFGFRTVKLRFLGGVELELVARYHARSRAGAEKGKGVYFGLLLLGIHHHGSPALASEVAQSAAAMNSLEDARTHLAGQGIRLSRKQIGEIAYGFSQRARLRQTAADAGIPGNLRGRRVVVSTDGGRVRIRKNKRGKKTKKGRTRYRTDWREPKLLAIYVVDEQGRIDREFSPVLDGTLKGPDAVFGLIAFYLSQLQIDQATKVLFIADGAKWIWNRVADLWRQLGLRPEQCLELVDFYHVVEHLHTLAGLNQSWKKGQRKRWVKTQANRLKRGQLEAFTAAVKKRCRGRRAKAWRREREYLLRNAAAGRLDYATVRQAQLPIGSGIIESTVRRVINLRMKGASIYWTEENAEAMIFLRAYYKSGYWQVLENKALESPLNLAT